MEVRPELFGYGNHPNFWRFRGSKLDLLSYCNNLMDQVMGNNHLLGTIHCPRCSHLVCRSWHLCIPKNIDIFNFQTNYLSHLLRNHGRLYQLYNPQRLYFILLLVSHLFSDLYWLIKLIQWEQILKISFFNFIFIK